MSKYDFHSLLEPLEFEKLVCDVIKQRDGIALKMYKEGPDKGIDGLYIDGNSKIVVQVKRCPSDFKKLYRDLKNNELPKVRKIKPDRYILGVSMDFSPQEEDNIINLFEGFIVNQHDIISSKDLNGFLEEPDYKQTLLRCPKLWFPNANVLEKIMVESTHRAIYRESFEELEEAIRASTTFVPTQIYFEALHKCSQNHVIVLSGEPGMGKTTMAYILALAYLQPDHLDGFVWAQSIDDVYSMLENGKQQVMILDDFWGSIFLGEHTRRNDESRLDKLIKRIVAFHGEKRLILTTREYILQQGLQKHPLLRKTLDQYALICTLEDYGDDEKASILYNHLYASNLEYEYVRYLFAKTDWIVHHQNYNPRVLALFLNNQSENQCSPAEYYDLLSDYFDHPEEFWESIFIDLSVESQFFALLLLISSTPMHLEHMKRCYEKYIMLSSRHTVVKNIGECIAELEKTMIKTLYHEDYDAVLLRFSMPAVQDFLYGYLQKNSESLIPKLLECCVYYNQLQFLLRHLSSSCSSRVTDLIVQHCIDHYHDYPDSILEYDGSWNWDGDLHEENASYLDRFLVLLRCCQQNDHPLLYRFLEDEIHQYCSTMGDGNPEAQYMDLHNLPGIIIRCIGLGMSFDGKTIIAKYYENAFSVYHYQAMQQFQMVFPEEYSLFHNRFYPTIKNNFRSTILSELDFLEEFGLDYRLDMLIDNIPDLLKQFGLRYTRKFAQEIYNLCGREPRFISDDNIRADRSAQHEVDASEQTLANVKEDAEDWLLGPTETYLEDDQIDEIITNSKLDCARKEELKAILQSGTPLHIYDLLRTKETIHLLVEVLCTPNSQITNREVDLITAIIVHISQGEPLLLQKLVSFCAECSSLFIYRAEPVLRAKQFVASDVYTTYLENHAQLREIVFEHLIIRDEQWIRFLHIPLFIFCNACIICLGSDDEELEAYYAEILKDNTSKFKRVIQRDGHKQVDIFYAEYFPYHFENDAWEGYMYTMFEELRPFHFNETFVAPMIRRYLDQLGDGDDSSKILNILSLSKLKFEYRATGNFYHSELTNELCMIEHLGISELWDFDMPSRIPKKQLTELQQNGYAHQHDKKWSIYVYKIKDIPLLKEWGVYEAAFQFLQKVEGICSRFDNHDYSIIKTLA